MPAKKRSTDSVIYVYCNATDKKRITEAATALAKTLPGARLPVHAFVLQAALKEAERVLGASEKDASKSKGKGG